MPEPRASRDGRASGLVARVLAFAGLAVLVLSLTVFKMSNNDIWIHLKTGEIVASTWDVPDKDPYSFTASDRDYVAHEWLSGVLFYLVYAAAGVTGLIVFKAAVIVATCIALYGACWFRRDRLVVLMPCFALMLLIGSARYLERPHIFTYLFSAIYLFVYFAYRDGGRDRRWLYALPPLHAIWTNLHGGHYQGIFLLVMLAAAEAVMLVRARRLGLAREEASPARDVALFGALPLLCLAAGLVNPYGTRLLTFPFELTGQEIFMKGIYEWQPPYYPAYNISSMFLYYVLWIAVLFGSFLLVGSHRELRRGLRDAAGIANILLGALWAIFAWQFYAVYKAQTAPILARAAGFWLAVVALFLLANAHRLQFHHAGIVALFFALSMRHNRAVTDAAVATLPTLSGNVNRVLDRLGARGAAARRPSPVPDAALAAIGILMLGLGAYTFTHTYYFSFNPTSGREMGLGIAGNMPVGAVEYVARNRITGNCMTAYNAAALLIHRMWPDVKVSMDSRNDVYGEALYREYRDALSSATLLDAYLKKHPVEFILMTPGGDVSGEFFRYLDDSPDWTLVYLDDRFLVYLKEISRFQEITRRDGYQLLRPSRAGGEQVAPQDAARWMEEADRAAAAAPTAWTPLYYRTRALLALGRHDDAIAGLRRAVESRPDLYQAWTDLASIHAQRGEIGPALEALSGCLEARPGHAPCREAAQRLKAGR